jgi:hypothetical protein
MQTYFISLLQILTLVFTLRPGHHGHLLGPLDHVGAGLLPDEAAVLEEALVAWESVGVVTVGNESCDIDNKSSRQLEVKFSAVRERQLID